MLRWYFIYPSISSPFGSLSVTYQTKSNEDQWIYQSSETQCYGIRITHQPSPWMEDHNSFTIIPYKSRNFDQLLEDARRELYPGCKTF